MTKEVRVKEILALQDIINGGKIPSLRQNVDVKTAIRRLYSYFHHGG
jgi:hypothetical protein